MSKGTLNRVLVANRGEIARRIFRGCHEQGLAAVAVYMAAEADAAWLSAADEAVLLPGDSPGETYLNIDAVVDAARAAEADAIHPGYGFLSENPDFAEAVEAAGITFIGPTPEAMRSLGSKVAAKEVAQSGDVPTVPGIDGAGLGADEIAERAKGLPFPLLVKASAGGGGRGMRIVDGPADLPDAVRAARAEAGAAFGDDHILVERYFPQARHVEVQVLGDGSGRVVHAFERECSVQRRYQKIIEEAPSPALDPDLRRAMTRAAVSLAEAVDYRSAGTVEFLLASTGEFFLLEVNTRLQVEHPVTELVTDQDLVSWQLRLAADPEALPDQSLFELRGHAIEARVYAENPATGFLPSTGELVAYRPPEGPGIRCDDGLSEGGQVSSQFDPMIAKIIGFGADREAARRRLLRGLRDMVVLGVTTNLSYLLDILTHPTFIAGDATTQFLDEAFAGWQPPGPDADLDWQLAAAFESLRRQSGPATANGGPALPDPWERSDGWRNTP